MKRPQIGMGCASMGSRKSRADSMAALERAYASGVRWFDVAPSYGDGAAEVILGEFARTRRPYITIVTKVGILPGKVSLVKRIARPILRMALSLAPGLRHAIKRSRPAATKQPLTPQLIEASVDASLLRLNTRQIDVLLLHDASPEEVSAPANIAIFDRLLKSGKVARIGIASSTAAAAKALIASDIYSVVQFVNNPFEPGMGDLKEQLAGRQEITVVTHSVFGSTGMLEAIAARAEANAELAQAFVDGGYSTSTGIDVASFLADYALVPERADIILMSMFSRKHLTANLASLERNRDLQKILRISSLLGA